MMGTCTDMTFSGLTEHVYSIDKSTGQATPIGDMGYGFVYAQDGLLTETMESSTSLVILTMEPRLLCSSAIPKPVSVRLWITFNMGAMLNAFAIPFGPPDTSPTADFTFTPLIHTLEKRCSSMHHQAMMKMAISSYINGIGQ